MHHSVIGALLMLLLLGACQNTAQHQTGTGATAIPDNLVRVDHSSAILTRIAPTAPKDDNRSRPTGRNKVFSEGAGKMGVEVIFSDAETGEALALAKDTRSGSSIWGVNNSVTNAAEVRRVFNPWAMQTRAQLDQVHKKE